MTRRLLICAVAVALLVPAGTASAAEGDVEPRIVGGDPVSIDQYPWQAAVAFSGSGSAFNRQFCGGSLVTSRIVLTAAHCVEDTDPDPGCVADIQNGCTLDPDDVTVILGRTKLSNSSQGVEHAVVDVAYQDDYDPDFNGPNGVPSNDVGYLVLAPTTPTTQARIRLAGENEDSLWAPGVFADITGWGTTSFQGSKSDNLLAASVPIVSDASCSASYGGDFNPATMICAGYEDGGIDTCQGDSGGPLQSPLLGGGYRLVGITSWGAGCAEPGLPGVYTRVAQTALRDAIVDKVEDVETDNGLAHEDIVGSGGQPRGGDGSSPLPPPSSDPGISGSGTSGQQALAGESNPCDEIKNRLKRRLCNAKRRCRAKPVEAKRKACIKKAKRQFRKAKRRAARS